MPCAALTRFFSNQCLEFEVQLVLDRTQAPGTELDFDAPNPARLGWVSWLKTAPLGMRSRRHNSDFVRGTLWD